MHSLPSAISFHLVWCGLMWSGLVWSGLVWCGVVWCGVVWCGVVWWGLVWCGQIWSGLTIHSSGQKMFYFFHMENIILDDSEVVDEVIEGANSTCVDRWNVLYCVDFLNNTSINESLSSFCMAAYSFF